MTTGDQGERVTLADRLARIETKLDIYLERQSCIDADVAALKIKAGEHTAALNAHSEEIRVLRSRDTIGTRSTGILAAIAGAIGLFKA